MNTNAAGQVMNQVGASSAVVPRSSVGEQMPDGEGKWFYSNTPGSTYIYTDGAIEIFKVDGNFITDKERIRQLNTAADRSGGLIHTRVPVEEVMVRPDKLAEARQAILDHASNKSRAASDPRLAELLRKAEEQSRQQASQKQAAAAPLGATSTAGIAAGAADSNSGTNKV